MYLLIHVTEQGLVTNARKPMLYMPGKRTHHTLALEQVQPASSHKAGCTLPVQEADIAAGTVRERSFRAFLEAGGASKVSTLELDIVSCAVCITCLDPQPPLAGCAPGGSH